MSPNIARYVSTEVKNGIKSMANQLGPRTELIAYPATNQINFISIIEPDYCWNILSSPAQFMNVFSNDQYPYLDSVLWFNKYFSFNATSGKYFYKIYDLRFKKVKLQVDTDPWFVFWKQHPCMSRYQDFVFWPYGVLESDPLLTDRQYLNLWEGFKGAAKVDVSADGISTIIQHFDKVLEQIGTCEWWKWKEECYVTDTYDAKYTGQHVSPIVKFIWYLDHIYNEVIDIGSTQCPYEISSQLIFNWLNHIVIDPQTKTNIIAIIRGLQGIGKTRILEFFF